MPQSQSKSSDLSSMVFATQARVTRRAVDTAALLKVAEQRSGDADVFRDIEPFFWPNEISSNRIDAYYTRMDAATTLPNFAADAARGVAFLAGHDVHTLPFGSTLTGAVETVSDVTRVVADAYTLPGLMLSGVDTTSFITSVRAGIVRDVSVGFYGGQWICDICGRDMLTDWWDCWHVPGLLYEVKDASGGAETAVREVLCTGRVRNAPLAEVSAVYDGATPGAAILQAERAAESGHLSPMQARLLEQRYRINLPGKRLLVAGAELPNKETEDVSKTRNTDSAASAKTPTAVELEAVSATTDEVETPAPEGTETPEAATAATATSTDTAEVRSTLLVAERLLPNYSELRSILGIDESKNVEQHVRQLMAEAEDGRTYRKDLVEEALTEGVRAMATFNPHTYRALLENAPIPTIRQMRDDWAAQGTQRFGSGRATRDGAAVKNQEDTAPAAKPAPVPDGAFA